MRRTILTSPVMIGGVPRPAGYPVDDVDGTLIEALISRGLAVITDPPDELPKVDVVDAPIRPAPARVGDPRRGRR